MVLTKKYRVLALLLAVLSLDSICSWAQAKSAAFKQEISSARKQRRNSAEQKACQSMSGGFAELLEKWSVPGAQLAVCRDGKLVFSKAYGFADLEASERVRTDSLFRIGSVSKIFTAVAVLNLSEKKKLNLDDRVFSLIEYPETPGIKRDPRLSRITVRQLLTCCAGWDRKQSGDPMFGESLRAASLEYSNSLRPTLKAIIRHELDKRLDFDPGTRFAYSNFSYALLGEVVTKLSGQKYSRYVQSQILSKMGICGVFPGRTRERLEREVKYYGYPGECQSLSLFPNIRGNLPLQYGGEFCLEALTADCGWIASAQDLSLFASKLFSKEGARVLSPETTRLMLSRPALNEWAGQDAYFSMGWEVQSAEHHSVKKEGSLPGSSAFLICKPGFTAAILANSRPLAADAFQDDLGDFLESLHASGVMFNLSGSETASRSFNRTGSITCTGEKAKCFRRSIQ